MYADSIFTLFFLNIFNNIVNYGSWVYEKNRYFLNLAKNVRVHSLKIVCNKEYRLYILAYILGYIYSNNSIWVVCHLFPRQRWRMHTYSVSGTHWPGEPRDMLKTTSAHKFRPAFGVTSKTCIFYKYVVFKHSFSFYNFFAAATHSLQGDSTDIK